MLEGWNDGIMIGNKFFLQLNGMKTKYSIFDGFVKSRNLSIFVIPAPYQVRGKLQGESSKFKEFWTPASAGVTVF